ncbi:hypothetical protein [Methanosphaera sp. BMS]|uniref:hypothetical protein n=1 Tax=Methanosphaera sp. BMS TaxID=1789762 RepID=UPI000DC1BF7B|nr:hypothetical protein [Methanosphaera sp. BMS]AWX31842.1 hypothetical protein AW729_01490 [Methanosphaera sp. BMS]
MAQIVDYKCNNCGNTFEWEDFYLIYRKDGEIVENECLMITSRESYESDLRGEALLTYCDDCKKKVKIYTVDEEYSEEDKKRFGEEIKEYMKHKRPRNTIKTFIEEVDYENISCPKCEKKLSLEYTFSKCPKCGSENIVGYVTMAD